MISDSYFYDALEVSADCSSHDIKKAYAKKFSKINENEPNDNFRDLVQTAYFVLINPKLRRKYDKEGLAVLDEINQTDLNTSFNQTSHTPKSSRLNSSFMSTPKHSTASFSATSSSVIYEKSPTIRTPKKQRRSIQTFDLQLSLKELYNGCAVPLGVEIEETCHKCHGKGVLSPIKCKCRTCNGSGRVYISCDPYGTRKVSPRKCPDCFGQGSFISKKKTTCKQCLGYGIEKIQANIDVEIKPGTADGDRLSVSGYDDIRIAIIEKKSSKFIREGNDLYAKKNISLTEAICGTCFPLKHLDGRILMVKSEPNAIIKPGAKLIIENEGFPILESDGEKGDLYIIFNVIFPTSEEITPQLRSLLMPTIRKNPIVEQTLSDDVYILQDGSLNDFGRHSNRNRHYQSDDYSDYYSEEDSFEEEDFDII